MSPAPEPRRVVVNATPLIALSILGRLDLLRDLYGEVLVPDAVYREVLAGGPHRPAAKELPSYNWLRRTELSDPRVADLLTDLDRGEAEVIALALERKADLVIIDERLARLHAKRLQLPLTGTLGILIRAKSADLLESLTPSLQRLQTAGIYLSPDLVKAALDLAGEPGPL